MTLTDREELTLMSKIADRAIEIYAGTARQREKIQWVMDLEAVHEEVGLRLQDLLDAPDMEFCHDLGGIYVHLNRETKQLERCFHPRHAK